MTLWLELHGWKIAAGFCIALILLVCCCTTVPDKATNRRINTAGWLLALVLGLIVAMLPGRHPGESKRKRQ